MDNLHWMSVYHEEEQKELQRLREVEKLYNELISRKRPREEELIFYETVITHFEDDYKCRYGDWSNTNTEHFLTLKEALTDVLNTIEEHLSECNEEEEEEKGGGGEETEEDLKERIDVYKPDLKGEYVDSVIRADIYEVKLKNGKFETKCLYSI